MKNLPPGSKYLIVHGAYAAAVSWTIISVFSPVDPAPPPVRTGAIIFMIVATVLWAAFLIRYKK